MSVLETWWNRYREFKHPHEAHPDIQQLNFLAAAVYLAERDLGEGPTIEKAELVLERAEEFAVLYKKCNVPPSGLFWLVKHNNPRLFQRIMLWSRQVHEIRSKVANHLLVVQENQLTSQGVPPIEIERTGVEFMTKMTPLTGVNWSNGRPLNRVSEIISENGWRAFEESIAANGTLPLEMWLTCRQQYADQIAKRNSQNG